MVRYSVEERERLVAEFEAGSMSSRMFCREHGLVQTTFDHWVRLHRKEQEGKRGVALVRVTNVGADGDEDDCIAVVVGKALIRVKQGFDGKLLRDVVAALSEDAS